MKLSENTVLITGGGSAIGRGLAEAFHQLGSTVIIAGRRQSALDQVASSRPGMKTMVLDQGEEGGIDEFTRAIAGRHPATVEPTSSTRGVAERDGSHGNDNPVGTDPTYHRTIAAPNANRDRRSSMSQIIPPYVQTDLAPSHGTDPRAMPLADFIGELMTILRDEPSAAEVIVASRCASRQKMAVSIPRLTA